MTKQQLDRRAEVYATLPATMSAEAYATLTEEQQTVYYETRDLESAQAKGRFMRIAMELRAQAASLWIDLQVTGMGIQLDDGKGLRWEVYAESRHFGQAEPARYHMWSGEADSKALRNMIFMAEAVMDAMVASAPVRPTE